MKTFKHLALLLLATAMVFGCSKYDDTELKNDVNDIKSRVGKLEEWVKTANSDISALQGLITALQNNDYVKGVTPVMEDAKEVGYTITFTKSKPVTIKHGKDGVKGEAPLIGVDKDADGFYYWTIKIGNAEATWLRNGDGKQIPTTGDKGHTPVLSIEKEGGRHYWKVDGRWLMAGNEKAPATGEQGDSFFDSVTPDAEKGRVVFKLADGKEFTLPMSSTTVSFDTYTPLQIADLNTGTEVIVKLPTTLKKADFAAIKADITNVAGTNTVITRATTEKWTLALTAPTFKKDGTLDAQPTVIVTVPANAQEGETALLEVTVVDTKGEKSTSTRVLFYSNKVDVAGVTLDKEGPLTIKVGKTETLAATVTPVNASNKNVTWESSDINIATVADGTVTGVKEGTATITVTTEDGRFEATCEVAVENIAVTGITLTNATVPLGGKTILTATIVPTEATIKTVTWSSSHTAVATINDITGEVVAIAKGETTITATSTANNAITATSKLMVVEVPYLEVNGIKVAVGNLVANGANGAQIGKPTDGGLFFQFGSLVGWASTDEGKPTIAVKPNGFAGNEEWADINKIWLDKKNKKDVPFTAAASENEKKGIGDPCRYYLGGTWRLPAKAEFEKLLFDKDKLSGDWTLTELSVTHNTSGLIFPASGYINDEGALRAVEISGCYWSTSVDFSNYAHNLYFSRLSGNTISTDSRNTVSGRSVRCVQ